MGTKKSHLKDVFEATKSELEKDLKELYLPEDVEQVRTCIEKYLNELFDSNGDFRQNLTIPEDYILQAAMNIATIQQETNFIFTPLSHNKAEKKDGIFDTSVRSTSAMAGSVGGALLGKVLLGSWGAVAGALTGTAIAIYLSFRNEGKNPQERTAVDVSTFISIIDRLCDSVDGLIETFRTQICRVVDSYERQEKPSLEKNYASLVSSIQKLCGTRRMYPSDTNALCKTIDNVEESFADYGLTLMDYNSNNEGFFEIVFSDDIKMHEQIYPAVLRGEHLVAKGLVYMQK